MKKLIWRYIVLGLLPAILLATSDTFCLVCHENKINFSKLVPENVWYKLTSDGGKQLRQIHKNNLDVQAYFKSDAYDEKALFRYVSFFSDTQREYDAKKFAKRCFVCHQNKLHLSAFYTKREWYGLNHSLTKLIKKHQYQKLVVKELKSQQFRSVLPEFITYISFHAPDKATFVKKDTYYFPKKQKKAQHTKFQKQQEKHKTLKITDDTNLTMPPASRMSQLRSGYIALFYDNKNLHQEQAKIIMQEISATLKKASKKQRKMKIWLYQTKVSPYVSDTMFSLMTLMLAPVRYDNTWIMKVESEGKVYYAKVNVITRHGIFADEKSEKNETLKEKIVPMLEDIWKQMKRK